MITYEDLVTIPTDAASSPAARGADLSADATRRAPATAGSDFIWYLDHGRPSTTVRRIARHRPWGLSAIIQIPSSALAFARYDAC
ncbi:MAG TPA: hypothetical protein VN253_10400 [Kofleriaceae bacterium]|nr:hypothetical protein [Kofleriaceae bacterium]